MNAIHFIDALDYEIPYFFFNFFISIAKRFANMSRLGFPSHILIKPLLSLFCVFNLKSAFFPILLIFAVRQRNYFFSLFSLINFKVYCNV